MTVTITITPPKILTRGWHGFVVLTITNIGDENIKDLYVKLDSAAEALFSLFNVYTAGGYQNCLNTYISSWLSLINGDNELLPAGVSKQFTCDLTVKSDAALGAATLTWYIQYVTY